jgi:AraC-like DNA-binding protein
METVSFDDVPSPFAAELRDFVDFLQVLAADAESRREPHAQVVLNLVKALPRVATAAEFLLLRSILAEFAARAFPAWDGRSDALLALAQAQMGSDLAALFTRCASSVVGPAAEPATIRDLRAKRASALIAERCCDPVLDAKQIAQAVGVSPEYLRKLLHTCYGCGFRVARRRARVQLAAGELENSFASIKEISTRLGYSSTSQLDRDFKMQHGISPGEYRRRVLTTRDDRTASRDKRRLVSWLLIVDAGRHALLTQAQIFNSVMSMLSDTPSTG